MPNDYYPPQSGGLAPFDVWDAHQKAFSMIYSLRDRIAALEKGGSAQPQESSQPAGGPSNTTINGLRVQAIPPKNGQTLKYNASTGQLEWS